MKTLVRAEHTGNKANGADGCYTRWANQGRCGGESTANWLNGLGDDADEYTAGPDGAVVTCGDVRRNWLNAHAHIVKAD